MILKHKRLASEINLSWHIKQAGLPLFAHNPNSGMDLYEVLLQQQDKFGKAVIHTLDETYELVTKVIDLKQGDVCIRINGCSLKTSENLEVVKQLPLKTLSSVIYI